MHRVTVLLFSASLSLLTCRNNGAETPWMGEEGDQYLSLSLVYEEYTEFWSGKNKVKLPSSLELWTVWLNYGYNITDELAFGITTGYTQTHFAPGTRGDISGIADSKLSINYLLNDEFANELLPITVTAQAAGILAGTYKLAGPGNPHGPGDGANALQTSLLLGKMFDLGVSIYGEIGYRWRDSGVPNDLFYSVGAAYQFYPDWSLSAGYVSVRAQSGLDVGVPPFNPEIGFPKLKEVRSIMEFGLYWNPSYQHTLSFNYARVLDGRNTGQSDIFSLAHSFHF